MKITRENYEAYFIDLLDGTLNEKQVDELLDFMRENPDLSEEIRDLEKVKLIPNHEIPVFNHTGLLKTDLDVPEVLEETCIRSIENDLTENEATAFDQYINTHPSAKRELRLFKATISEPDPFVVYEDKAQLKRSRKLPVYWMAAAAMVAIIATFWFTVPNQSTVIERPLIETAQISIEEPIDHVELASFTTEIVPIEENRVALEETPEAKTEIQKPVEAPIQLLASSEVDIQSDALMVAQMETEIVPVLPPIMKRTYYPTIPELLAQEASKIDPREEAGKLGRFLLNKLRNITDEKLDYKTTENGHLSRIEYNSKLLAFSIPVNSNEN